MSQKQRYLTAVGSAALTATLASSPSVAHVPLGMAQGTTVTSADRTPGRSASRSARADTPVPGSACATVVGSPDGRPWTFRGASRPATCIN